MTPNSLESKLIDLIRSGDTISRDEFSLTDIASDSMPTEPERFDWRGKVPAQLRRLWPELSLETRLALCLSAQLEAFWDI